MNHSKKLSHWSSRHLQSLSTVQRMMWFIQVWTFTFRVLWALDKFLFCWESWQCWWYGSLCLIGLYNVCSVCDHGLTKLSGRQGTSVLINVFEIMICLTMLIALDCLCLGWVCEVWMIMV